MNECALEEIINAVLYEGYILYPYRPSARKNQRERFTFGRVYPEAYSLAQNGAEPCVMQTECLARTLGGSVGLTVSVRFLQPMLRETGILDRPITNWDGTEPTFRLVPELRTANQLFQTWCEAVERRVDVPESILRQGKRDQRRMAFQFPAMRTLEPVYDWGKVVGVLVRQQAEIKGTVSIDVQPAASGVFKITAAVLNQTRLQESGADYCDGVLLRTFASTHAVLRIKGGEFISLMDPAEQYKQAAESCRNIGTWPVLVGDEQKAERDTLLSSPIILYDYPKVAPESRGPLFDGTEIDEMLTLRIRTMTDEEKLEMRNTDERARRLLERTERITERELAQLHGTIRKPPIRAPIDFDDFFGANTLLQGVTVSGVHLKPGDLVRIRPKARADVMDMALSGQIATIEAIEQDLECRVHLAVVLESDLGKDLGLMRQPGHRFFFGIDEVEPARTQDRGHSVPS